jgi:hypothetical protein
MKTKFNLDRKTLKPDYISSKQDFNQVVKNFNADKVPIWKSPWFYGPAGLATLALLIGLVSYNNSTSYENNDTLKPSKITYASSLPDDTPCIKPVSETTDLAFEVYAIDPKKGGNIILSSGSEIQISKNSLISQTNEPVEVRVREFKSKSAAFLAGIPMDYGKNSTFESAGMIEIRAVQNGKEVKINADKPIEVSLLLYKNPESFGFWYLNESTKKWQKQDVFYKTHDLSEKKEEISICEKSLAKVKSKLDTCYNSISQLEKQKPENSLLPTLGSRKLQIEFDANDFPELKGYKDIEFEYVQYSEDVAKVLKSQVWNDVELKKSNDYLAIFKNAKGQQAVKVRPVLKGKSLTEVEEQIALAEQVKMEELARLKTEKESLKNRELILQAKYDGLVSELKQSLAIMSTGSSNSQTDIRSVNNLVTNSSAEFQVNRWGVYNSDKPISYPNPFPMQIAFKDDKDRPLELVSVYVFDHKKDTRYSFGIGTGRDFSQIGWNKNPTTVIAIDREGRLFYTKHFADVNLQEQNIKLDLIHKNEVNLNHIQNLLNENISRV